MDAAEIRARASAPWTDVRVLDSSPSTNAAAVQAALAGAPEGLVIVTQDQTQGRGRLDRSWRSPRGAGLAVSVLLRPDRVPTARWPWLPLLTGVAVCAAVREVGGVPATLKWPNDVLVGERKLAGILLERVERVERGRPAPAAVVGVGLNVAMTAEQLPVPQATSLAVEGAQVEPARLLGVLLERLGAAYVAWCAAGGDPDAGLRAEYTAACGTLGARVRVRLPDGSDLSGRASAVDGYGRLEVDTGERTVAVGAGDVIHLRPAT